MTSFLLDANVVIAATVAEHEHHAAAVRWLEGTGQLAVCPIVEGALVRFLLRVGESSGTARAVLRALRRHPRLTLWPDALSFADLDLTDVRGHRQVTDVYLAALAAAHGARLATFDTALAALRPDRTFLVPRG